MLIDKMYDSKRVLMFISLCILYKLLVFVSLEFLLFWEINICVFFNNKLMFFGIFGFYKRGWYNYVVFF